ncbi:MAG: major capsid protein [Thiothrix sp.]|uniref:major capsid protein n=1 Tax=Thiothrix sp. TaxID=1032 RepID=UPI002631C6E6|nr:major capsid protein [Thiothrix sp.]MDD5395232.1 major capsid protein [Thiothrix sp.]
MQDNKYDIEVTATDNAGNSTTQEITVTVTDIWEGNYMFETNPFSPYSAHEISTAINIMPVRYGYLTKSGLFRNKGLTGRVAIVEENEGTFRISEAKPVGSQGQAVEGSNRRIRTFAVPHFPHDDHIAPADVEGLRRFGGNTQESVTEYLNERLQQHRTKHEITLEYLMIGALKGQVMDGGGRVVADLWAEYGVAAQTMNFVLNNSATKVRTKAVELSRKIEDALMGDTKSGIEVLCSPEFFDALIEHGSVHAAYTATASAPGMIAEDLRNVGFKFGGVTFKEYRASAPNAAGAQTKFIEAGKARAYPLGTMDTFNLYAAPADFNETIGTLGQLYYGKVEPAKFNRGYDLHSQFNPLPICLRPKSLFELSVQ